MAEELKDIGELIEIAKKINSGEYDITNISINPESELFEIAKYFSDAVKKLSEVSNTMEDSFDDLPLFEKVLTEVINDTKKASEEILNLSDNINFILDEVKENIKLLKDYVHSGDFEHALGVIDRILDKTIEGQDVSFDMIATLEFQDISKQKIDKLIRIIKVLERKVGELVIKLGLKDNKIDINTLNRAGNIDEILNDQDIVDALLKEFGN
ncbi:protein phosphatase CheZ [Deferribacteraceae bacterium V6Fe1]|nr:protein phosphatase CheZ [Deferribacteraceae bacterium V6Fe1]